MKIRTGFVSNSSSSSFIVAFPHKPTSSTEVLNMLFSKNSSGFLHEPYGEGKVAHTTIADTVFGDIQNADKLTAASIKSEFSSRYYVHDGKMYYAGSPYHGTDKKLVEKLITLNEKYESDSRKCREAQRELIIANVGKAPKYAYKGGTDWNTKQPYSDKDIEVYEEYTAKINKFEKTNPEYIALDKQESEICRTYWAESGKISDELAEADYKAFKKDNEGKYLTSLTYSDNDGSYGCLMEHGGVFDNIPHVRISHH
jgi:hypothetical protein